jgi:hypothetical protein
MRALVIYCHPRRGSFTEAVRDVVLEKLQAVGAEVRLRDLYAEGFDPVLSAREHESYEDEAINRDPVATHCDDVVWCDTLIFVYPDLVVRAARDDQGLARPGSGAGARLPDAGRARMTTSARASRISSGWACSRPAARVSG